MQTKSKIEQTNIAKDVFKRYPNANKIAVTSDGTAFVVDVSENAVKNYSKKNRSGKELKIEYFTREDILPDNSSKSGEKSKTAEQLIAEIEAAETVEMVDAIRDIEAQGKNRKTVIEAADKKSFELSKSDD